MEQDKKFEKEFAEMWKNLNAEQRALILQQQQNQLKKATIIIWCRQEKRFTIIHTISYRTYFLTCTFCILHSNLFITYLGC